VETAPGAAGPGVAPGDPLSVGSSPARPPFAVRFRRGALATALVVVGGAATAAAPWIALGVMALLVWLLRTGSYGATDLAERRLLRGAKWYDAPRVVVRAPWELVRSIPTTLLLLLWSVGLALAVMLIAFALGSSLTLDLFVGGVMLTAMLALGPGSDRLRGPLRRVGHPLAAEPRRWGVGMLVVLALAAALGWSTLSHGIRWAPDDDQPKVAHLLS
ncbi:MAG: hypothetical protein QM638_05445, partial [Nocardioides sp.]|uniref:hypothetical protein n=1 Tax=Nocardioides sp. TaxID=35761 RepID=UPI0039E6EE31